MSSETYEILALAARYWFIALAVLFVIKGWRVSVKDNRNAKVLRDWAGGAGCVGELLVLEDGVRSKKRSLRGARLPVPMEGLIGSGGTADIRIKHPDVRRKHIWFAYQPGKMTLTLVGKAQADMPVTPDGRRILREGDQLTIGRLKMTMVFYSIEDASAASPVYVRKVRPAKKRSSDDFDDHYEESFWE
ncbi:MAG: hypothetical protein IJE08_11945 [Clostridia bacterium]|nr:hypothetical protein [Clostridia bacterium]